MFGEFEGRALMEKRNAISKSTCLSHITTLLISHTRRRVRQLSTYLIVTRVQTATASITSAFRFRCNEFENDNVFHSNDHVVDDHVVADGLTNHRKTPTVGDRSNCHNS